jgi:catechol 2,3-dioxygenase-like lactoylglutathione lyase family enzyme
MSNYIVGGIELPRPFRVQRLGHFAFAVDDQESCLRFYCDLLGMQISDTVDFSVMFGRQTPGRDGNVYFLRVAGDHHSTVLFPRWTMPGRPGGFAPGTEHLAHMAWQVGTLDEIIEGGPWLRGQGWTQARPGSRDPAGSNFNATVIDPNGLPNEIYYGMDQIGWDGLARPLALRPMDDQPPPTSGGFVAADLPDLQTAIQAGADLRSAAPSRPSPPARYRVDGVMLPRPFRVIRNSPVAVFVTNMEQSLRFYEHTLGLKHTETVDYQGYRCAFLRTNTEHHSVALLPIELRKTLGLWEESICAYYGLQVQNYRQLREAISFLHNSGVEIRSFPAELTPGIEQAALAIAPDGHGVLLYHSMEQVGWDGRPRPASQRRHFGAPDTWPDVITDRPDSGAGFVFQGPIG